MGSTGSGRFSDYSGTGSSSQKEGSSGGSSGTDRCRLAFSCILEEVAQCEYFSSNGDLPEIGATVKLRLNGRLFAEDSNGKSIGALPTKFHYLVACMESGIDYIGVVANSVASPVPSISVDFSPN